MTGRREIGRWRRESTVDAFVEFLNASFTAKDLCKSFCNEFRQGGVPDDRRKELIDRCELTLSEMGTQLTKLRLLSPKKVLSSCKDLYGKNREFCDIIKSDGDSIRDLRDLSCRQEIRELRNAAVRDAKKLMGIE